MRAVLVLSLCLIASPVLAQELGQTTAQLLADRPGTTIVPVSGVPGLRPEMALGDNWHAKLCDGVVVAESYRFGTKLEAFADEVEEETLRRGPPEFSARHGRSSAGEWGEITASWTDRDKVTVISLQSSGQGMQASRATTALESSCFFALAP